MSKALSKFWATPCPMCRGERRWGGGTAYKIRLQQGLWVDSLPLQEVWEREVGRKYRNFSLTHILKNKIYCLMSKSSANTKIT